MKLDYYNNNNKKKQRIDYKFKDESYNDVLIESIKCHHNAISNYIIDNLYGKINSSKNQYRFILIP